MEGGSQSLAGIEKTQGGGRDEGEGGRRGRGLERHGEESLLNLNLKLQG